MRYTYIVEKKNKNNELIVMEYMENQEDGFFPPAPFTEKIAETVLGVLNAKKDRLQQIILDDTQWLDKKRKRRHPVPEAVEPVDTEDFFSECSDETCSIHMEATESESEWDQMFPFDDVA